MESRSEQLRASPPMFESRLLDSLTRVHPAVPPAMYGPAIVVLGVLALGGHPLLPALAGSLGGYLLWTLLEYWVHRTIFHLEPDGPIWARVHWMIHGVHHDHPNDPRRLVLPPVVSLPFAILFTAAFVLGLGRPLGWAVAAGFYVGYLLYDMLHFALHHHRPRSRIGRRLHELHMRHHFQDDHRGFGVSAPWWDIVFGTYPRRRGQRTGSRETESRPVEGTRPAGSLR
jgi:sterol desaturase/sphingolipid hydroxylase (fatty acid hydroxylase superfamily)